MKTCNGEYLHSFKVRDRFVWSWYCNL